jgi:hypothetical protein
MRFIAQTFVPLAASFAVASVALTSVAVAQEQSPNPKAPSLPGSAEPEAAAPSPLGDEQGALAELPGDQRSRLLAQELAELRERVQKAEDERRQAATSPLSLSGYVDLGFFVPLGNGGVGWVRDVGNRQFPELETFGWTFLGDILGTPVNSRGEAADLGDAPGVDRFDSVDSDGAPGFIVNEVNLRVGYTLAESAILRTSINFLPRSATQDFAVGDFVEVDLAELEYVLTEDGQTSLFVGKILPVFGIEYTDRKSDQRFGITPSLIARYTTGPQLGAKLRSKLFNEWLVLAASVTNNTSVVEQFHFYREIDRNVAKTLNGRAALNIPLGGIPALEGDRLEIGFSGEWGAQDNDTRSDRELWFIGADLQYAGTNLTLSAQIMQGEAPGTSDAEVWALDLDPSGYVQLDWQAHSRLGFLLRADLRDAFVNFGTERAYVTDQARFTGGLRWLFSPHIIAKAEYYHNRELGDVEQFGNDMVTSSLLLVY